ncbi:MAG: hypothetical protein C0453_00150 [Comamonadaceae bacterium]|nr:hypothetical protein [Comamonadaceae bacterium]
MARHNPVSQPTLLSDYRVLAGRRMTIYRRNPIHPMGNREPVRDSCVRAGVFGCGLRMGRSWLDGVGGNLPLQMTRSTLLSIKAMNIAVIALTIEGLGIEMYEQLD